MANLTRSRREPRARRIAVRMVVASLVVTACGGPGGQPGDRDDAGTLASRGEVGGTAAALVGPGETPPACGGTGAHDRHTAFATCLTCHLPGHVADRGARRLLRWGGADGNAVCFACHPRGQWDGIDPHREAAEERRGCTRCHAAEPVFGRDTAATVTFVADVNIVCLACHDRTPHPGGVVHTRAPAAGSPVRIPDGLPLGSGRRITCATCHNPHLDPATGERLRGERDEI